MTPKEILIAARAKIDAPERWTKGEPARDTDGNEVEVTDCSASCFCLVGAIGSCVDGESATVDYFDCIDLIEAAIGSPIAVAWNDAPNRTHAEVLAAFDRAIAAAGDA